MLIYAADLDAFRCTARTGRGKNVRHGKWDKGSNFNNIWSKSTSCKKKIGKTKRPNLIIFAIKGDEIQTKGIESLFNKTVTENFPLREKYRHPSTENIYNPK